MRNRICHLMLIATVACKPAWHRTNVSSWVRQSVPALGIEVEVPPDIARSIRHPSSDSAVWFFPAGVEDEDAYIIVTAAKTPSHEREKKLSNKHTPRDEATRIRHIDPQMTEYWRDIAVSNGEVVRLHVFYTDFQFTAAQRREDTATIHRILSSATLSNTASD